MDNRFWIALSSAPSDRILGVLARESRRVAGATRATIEQSDAKAAASLRGTEWTLPVGDSMLRLRFASPRRATRQLSDLLTSGAKFAHGVLVRQRRIEEREAELRGIAGSLLDLEEASRSEISTRLHDETGQSLVCIRLQMELLQQDGVELAEMAERLAEARDVTERSILDVRRLISYLSPRVLDQFGLHAAIKQFAARVTQDFGTRIRVQFKVKDSLPKRVEVAAYRSIQDACMYLAARTHAKSVNISVIHADGVLRLNVVASGRNPSDSPDKPDREGFQLNGMRHRVMLLGGRSEVVNQPTTGRILVPRQRSATRIEVELPIAGQELR